MTAAKIDFQPADEKAILRDTVTFSLKRSRVSWKSTSNLAEFLAAAVETLDVLDKVLVDEDTSEPIFSQLASHETDLTRVRNAFDVLVTDPDQVRGEPDTDDATVAHAELLQDALIDVRGDPTSAKVLIEVGRKGSATGTLVVQPVEKRPGSGFSLNVGYLDTPSDPHATSEIKDAIQDSGLLTVYYESGHTFDGTQIYRQKLTDKPFPHFQFEDFTNFSVTTEKPRPKPGQSIHDAIAIGGENSIFAWVVHRFGLDWLVCDDGPGEVADFLHLADDGTLTAIHVKAAGSNSANRRIAVTQFEQVVSQAAKNIDLLDNATLIDQLSRPSSVTTAAWHAGRRVPSNDFVQQLDSRTSRDRTQVMLVQPHLLRSIHDQARASIEAGHPTRDSYSLMLLDNLLHGTRRTVTALWDDLTVIGCS